MGKSLGVEHQSANVSAGAKDGLHCILIGTCGIIVILVYVWFVSGGHWINWQITSSYYDQLANGFDKGQLSLPVKVDPALLNLRHPYDYNSRKDVPYLWDTSYYKGKVYLYWGPAPALILATIKTLYHGEIGDEYLSFAFIVGSLIFNILILTSIQRDFFKDLPNWAVLISILTAGWVVPILWNLGQAEIYVTAITAGQFFLLGGIYWVYTAFTHSTISKRHLVMTGIFWALAFGSRLVLMLPIAFLLALVVFGIARLYSFKKLDHFPQILPAIASIGVPILLGILAYGWYNWARFGSVYESGFRYQLNKDNLLTNSDRIFSTSYLHTNIHNYILGPLEMEGVFPFFKAPFGTDSLVSDTPGAIYHAKNIVGVLYGFPFALFAFVPLAITLLPLTGIKLPRFSLHKNGVSIPSISIGLAGSALLGIVPLLLYFRVAMRFLSDFIPALTLLAIIGFWSAYQVSMPRYVLRMLVAIAALGLAVFSILVSMAVSISFH